MLERKAGARNVASGSAALDARPVGMTMRLVRAKRKNSISGKAPPSEKISRVNG